MRFTATFEYTDEAAGLHIADRQSADDFTALAGMLDRRIADIGKAVNIFFTAGNRPDARASEEPDGAEPEVLADVAALLADAPRMPVQDVMRRLAERDERYRDWTNRRFKAAMDTAGAPIFKSNGRMHVHGLRVRAALDARAASGS